SVLAGFATAILATVLLDVPKGSPQRTLTFAAAAALALAAVLLVGTLFAYDRLMMPTRFWRTGRLARVSDPLHAWPVWRPPSSAAWLLFQHSVALWRWAGVALGLGALATWLLATAAIRPTTAAGWILSVAAGLVPLALALTWWHTQKPRLGFED